MIDGFVFDMDGVLFDTERLCKRCSRIVAESYGIVDLIDEIYQKSIGLNRASDKKLYEEMIGKDFPYDEYRESCSEYVRKVIAEEGMPVKPGAYMLLEYLKTNRYKVALATSTSKKSTMSHLSVAKMTEYFDVIITGDMVTNGKPDPEIYLKACEKLNIKPQNAVAIEDSPNGLKSATAAGLKTIMVEDMIPYSVDLKPFVSMNLKSLTDVLELLSKGEIYTNLFKSLL